MAGSTADNLIDSARGWRVVAGAFGATFVVFGVAYSFGAFFDPMAEEFDSGSGATSAVFALTTFVFMTLGLVTGRAADRFGPRPLLLISAVFLGGGLLLTSQVNSLVMGYVTYGGGVGIAVSCAYVPMVATVGAWFEKRRALALALAVTGIGLGTLLVAPLAAWLIGEVGWRDTYVILGITSPVVLVACSFLAAKPPVSPAAGESRPLGAAIRQPAFRWLYIGSFLMSLALFVPFVFLAPFAEDEGIGTVAAAALVGVIGASSVVGRLGLGVLSSRLGTIRAFQLSFLFLALSYAIWFVAGGWYPGLVIFAIIMGTSYGGFIALSPAVAAEKFGPVGLGGIIGALYTSAGIGGLVGPPAAGVLIDSAGYDATILIAMVIGLVAFVTLLPLTRKGANTVTTVTASESVSGGSTANTEP